MSAPLAPRDYAKLAFAPTSTNAYGGSPGCGVVVNNTLIYPYGSYTVDTDAPQIRIFDGTTDHLLAYVPDVLATTPTVCKAVISMIAANGVIYFSTLDTGASHSDWAGRVFELNPDSGDITVLGSSFSGGNLPYALAWHMGRLFVGTNSGAMADGYNVYFYRPGIDTSWTLDVTFGGGSAFSGITSMTSYKGQLFAGTAVGSTGGIRQALVLTRDSTGTYTSTNASGDSGATVDTDSAFVSLCEFGGNLYAGYFGGVSGTKKALIRKWNGSSWSTVYTGSSTTIIPFVQMFVDTPTSTMYVIGGGPSGLTTKQAVLLSTTDGSSYTNLSAQLIGSATALPLHAILAL